MALFSDTLVFESVNSMIVYLPQAEGCQGDALSETSEGLGQTAAPSQ